MRNAARWVVLVGTIAIAGCGDPNPVDKCKSFAATLCKKLFQCGAGSYFGSESDCEAKEQMQLDCPSWMLVDGCSYDWSQFDACQDDVADASCSALASGQLPPSCDKANAMQPVCAGGGVRCSDHSGSSGGSSCDETLSGCTDGHTYSLSCDGSGCRCLVDGAMTQTAATTTCSSNEKVLNQVCGWTLAGGHDEDMAPAPDMSMPPDMTPGCVIDGAYFAPGTVNPDNPCQICDSRSGTSWSPNDGASCGNGCGACKSSACGPVVMATGSQTLGIALDTSNLYWTDNSAGTLMKMPLAGGTATPLATALYNPGGVVVDASNAYWVGENPGSGVGEVYKVAKGGGTPTTLATVGSFPEYLTVDATSVYWTDAAANTVNKVALTGGTVTALATGQASPRGIAVSPSNVFWVNWGDGSVMKANLDGSNATTIASGPAQTMISITVDASNVYWGANTLIMKLPLAGGTAQALNPNELQLTAASLFVDSATSNIYWINASSRLERIALAGGNVKDVLVGQSAVNLVVGPSCVYFTTGSGVARAPK
jgi:sugar lactone lactonase YvrE